MAGLDTGGRTALDELTDEIDSLAKLNTEWKVRLGGYMRPRVHLPAQQGDQSCPEVTTTALRSAAARLREIRQSFWNMLERVDL